jgi:serine/threonine-protein kinase RsbW
MPPRPVKLNPTFSKARGLKLHVPCELAALRGLATQVRSFLSAQGIREKDVWACELALVEGCNNAVQHAAKAHAHGGINVEVNCSPECVELRINDHNQGFDWPEQVELPGPQEERGRGLYLIRTLMDHVHYIRNPSSNCLVLQKSLTGI